MMFARNLCWISCGAILLCTQPLLWAADWVEQGQRIYQDGRLSAGAPLTAWREGIRLSGAAAACVTCHKRSGMGAVEGTLIVPPIAGEFLFSDDKNKLVTQDVRRRKSFNQTHTPYNMDTLSRAICCGLDSDGRELSVVMPRFKLKDADMRALTAYLTTLSAQPSEGASAQSVRFATVITPEVTPARRKALIDTLRAAVNQKNANTVGAAGQGGRRRHMVSAAEMVLGTERPWELEIWELGGESDTWAAQLAERYRRAPVFALLSGVSNVSWQPVQDFCAQQHLPCWLPSVDIVPQQSDFYALYFSRGAALDGTVLAQYWRDQAPAVRPLRVVQFVREAALGMALQAAMQPVVHDMGIEWVTQTLGAQQSLREALRTVRTGDALLFAVRDAELAELSSLPVPPSTQSYFFARWLSGEAEVLPTAWRTSARLIYPYALPQQRRSNLAYFLAWAKLRGLPVVDEKLQSEAYFATQFMGDTLAEMLDNLYRDYLLERAENMLSQREGAKAEQETRERRIIGRAEDRARKYPNAQSLPATQNLGTSEGRVMRHEGTTVYPHLGLGSGQRYASKGAYIVGFDMVEPQNLIPLTSWIAP